jgi:cytidylate kinase
MSLIIALDGPAAAGKGTLARALAAEFDLAYLDTGSLYRATGVAVLQAGQDPADPAAAEAAAKTLDLAKIRPEDVRSEAAGEAASKVAAIPAVRAVLLAFQRRFAHTPPGGKKGAVLDGRDIGTVVCPEADVKIFVTASLEERSRRRVKELRDKGETVIEARVFADMAARDARDQGRGVAPLKPADDAFVLDTSGLDARGALAAAKAYIASKSVEITSRR